MYFILALYSRNTVLSICPSFSLPLQNSPVDPLVIECLYPLNTNCDFFTHIEAGKRRLTENILNNNK